MRFYWLFLCLISTWSNAAIDLNEAAIEKLVSERNNHVKAAMSQVDAQQILKGHLTRSFLPSINAFGGRENFKIGRSYWKSQPFVGVEAQINIFNSGKDRDLEKLRTQELEQAKLNANLGLRDELYKAKSTYWEVLYFAELEAILVDAIDKNKINLAASQKRFGAGFGSETDTVDFKITQTNLEQDLARIKQEKQKNLNLLRIYLGLNQSEEVKLEDKIPHVHEDKLLESKFKPDQNPVVLNDSIEISKNEVKAKQLSNWLSPQVDLYAGSVLETEREIEALTQSND